MASKRPVLPTGCCKLCLALQGVDQKSTGHFIYESQPEFAPLQPRPCTNRTHVINFLASLGASASVQCHPFIPAIPSPLLIGLMTTLPRSTRRAVQPNEPDADRAQLPRNMQMGADAGPEPSAHARFVAFRSIMCLSIANPVQSAFASSGS